MKNPILCVSLLTFLILGCEKDDENPSNTVKDINGNVYKTVTIGSQTWMVENLHTTMYNDGTPIPNVTDAVQWFSLTTGAYSNYNNTINTDSIATYGRLYNWYTISTGKLCPTGWHVPTDAEWDTLTTYLDGEDVAGGKLKETGTTHWWNSPNNGATNETGFTALPGGDRGIDGVFYGIGGVGCWWGATVALMEYSTALEASVAGGVRLSALPITPGTGSWNTTAAM